MLSLQKSRFYSIVLRIAADFIRRKDFNSVSKQMRLSLSKKDHLKSIK